MRLGISGCLALALGTVLATAAAAEPSADCATIASAKYQQWRQPSLEVERAKTFADGSIVKDLLIVTPTTAYKKDGSTWTSAGITVRERSVASPDHIMNDMKLATCTKSGTGYEAGTPVSIYTLTYATDSDGFTAHGTIWISDVTGLPVREEFNEPAPPANDRVAKMISATYHYNDDVVVPRQAELAESRRLVNNAAVVRNMQSGGGGLGGPQQ